MKKIAVIHYLPLEFYPPVTNMLDVISEKDSFIVKVWSTLNNKNRKEYTNSHLSKIVKSAFPSPKDNSIIRVLKYLSFNLRCFFGLILLNPDKILYYESYSVWPVYWYIKFFGKRVDLFIHYHEYFSNQWYEDNMRLVKYYHKLEQKMLYNKAIWISQTNKDRVNLFLEDNSAVSLTKLKIMPNYPPKKWSLVSKKDSDSEIIKTVYIGAISLKQTYIKEYCEWVVLKDGSVIFDIYTYNVHKDTEEYLTSLNSPYIHFYNSGIEYSKIPYTLNSYDVGVILYKAKSLNYKYNAPNKLFEYLTCGLTVWAPDVMLGILPYLSEQVISFDFNNLKDFHFNGNVIRKVNLNGSTNYIAEEVLEELFETLYK